MYRVPWTQAGVSATIIYVVLSILAHHLRHIRRRHRHRHHHHHRLTDGGIKKIIRIFWTFFYNRHINILRLLQHWEYWHFQMNYRWMDPYLRDNNYAKFELIIIIIILGTYIYAPISGEPEALIQTHKENKLKKLLYIHEKEKHYRVQGVKVQTLQKMGAQWA